MWEARSVHSCQSIKGCERINKGTGRGPMGPARGAETREAVEGADSPRADGRSSLELSSAPLDRAQG